VEYIEIIDTITRLLEMQENVKIHYKVRKGEEYDGRRKFKGL
jgi:hypothetical protein